jgi:hypothetical protein
VEELLHYTLCTFEGPLQNKILMSSLGHEIQEFENKMSTSLHLKHSEGLVPLVWLFIIVTVI